jgi:hypothetical protein
MDPERRAATRVLLVVGLVLLAAVLAGGALVGGYAATR